MQIVTVKSYDEMSNLASKMIAEQIKSKPDSVLGLATGSSPVGTYEKLIKRHKRDGLDFSCVTTFNLDEYCDLSRKHPQSYYTFMMENLFSHINIPSKNINFPDDNFEKYEKKIKNSGGIDLQLLGVGHNGHIGFNEPDDVFHNKTHKIQLAESTIRANARFFNSMDDVPKTAITMGIGTIMAAKKIILVAGADKASVINELKKETVSPQFPVSILHYHPNCTIIHASSS